MMTTIAIKNQSTVLTDTQVQTAVTALQIQVTRDWAPVWRTTATLVFLNKTQAVPAGAWPIYVLDTSDVSGALGYHDELASGVPYGRIFAKDAAKYGYSWTVTLSHELLEMLCDPNINLTVFRQTSSTAGSIYAYEVGDPVEADALGYKINNVLVSDFVYPAWFDQYQTVSGNQYDYGRHVTAPFQIAPGGYVSVFNVTRGSGWTQITHGDIEVAPGTDLSGRSRLDR
jgi:hypothetical protein